MIEGLAPHVAKTLRASDFRIVLTGAGGWIGMATLELLSVALGQDFANRVIAFGSRRRLLHLVDGTTIKQWPLADIATLEPAPTIVLHFAFLTKDRAETMTADDYQAANRQITETLLDALDPIDATAIFVASSGAAYRADDAAAAPAMRLYGSLKREEEELFADWAERQGKRAAIARIFNLSGPHINKDDSYALASFILDALASRPISIKAPHQVIRSYVAVRELMSVAFALLLDRRHGVTRFDSGGEPIELQQVAQAVADWLGPVTIARPPLDPVTTDRYVGDDDVYRTLLADHGIEPAPFARQVIETAEFIRQYRSVEAGGRVATGQ